VEFVALPDGMSRLTFVLPAVEGRTIPKYQVERDAHGTLSWTTPTGRTYTTRPHRY
jgi:hypothetical protein